MDSNTHGTPTPELLTAKQVAERLQLGRNRIYEMARSGALPSVRINETVRFPRVGLERWLSSLLDSQGQVKLEH